VIKLAREIVPHIEARPGAPAGIVETVKCNKVVDMAMDGDMILCRVTAPLVTLAFELIEAGKPAVVRGKEIGKQLGRLVETIARVDGFRFESFLTHAANYRLQQLFILSQKEDNDLAIESFCDRMRTIETLYRRAYEQGVRDERSFRMFVEAMFSDERKCITLATVHKSKGLENPRVFILHPELMPFPKAKRPQQIEQEWNLKYVALTRAKEALFFVESEA
jgi:superfamily I DNA/RNA helicase